MEPRESAEDYLEAILRVKEKQNYVRSVDVAKLMGVSKPSVTYATKKLRESGYISMDDNGMILFTETGKKLAEEGQIFVRVSIIPALSGDGEGLEAPASRPEGSTLRPDHRPYRPGMSHGSVLGRRADGAAD